MHVDLLGAPPVVKEREVAEVIEGDVVVGAHVRELLLEHLQDARLLKEASEQRSQTRLKRAHDEIDRLVYPTEHEARGEVLQTACREERQDDERVEAFLIAHRFAESVYVRTKLDKSDGLK